ESLSIALDVFLREPSPWDPAKTGLLAKAVLAKFADYRLQANQVRQRIGDALFDYDLSFQLFNNQAQVRFAADRLYVNLQNAKGQKDAEIVIDTLLRASGCLGPDSIDRFTLHVASHATFDDRSAGKALLASFSDSANHITGGG